MPSRQQTLLLKTERSPSASRKHRVRQRPRRLDRLKRKLVGLDTETTGTDFRHGCRPYYLSIFTSDEETYDWYWDVDPHTRMPIIPAKDIAAVNKIMDKFIQEDCLFIIQNAKFDYDALASVGITTPNWDQIEDPSVAHHLLASNEAHGLKETALRYLGIDDDDEDAIRHAVVQEALPMARSLGWDVKREKVGGKKFHHPHFPTQSKWDWKQEMWILRALAKHNDYPKDHPWWNLVQTYGMNDSIRALGVWYVFREALTDEGLWPIYRVRMNLTEPLHAAEGHGITINEDKLNALHKDFEEKLGIESKKLYSLAEPDFKNYKSSVQLKKLFYEDWELPVLQLSKSKKGPATDKVALAKLENALDHSCRAYDFIQSLKTVRKLTAAISYLNAYDRGAFKVTPGWRRLHTNINAIGTRTTRLSTSGPSQQNVSKQEKYNLRSVFCPLPGREFWSIDQSNVEMRLFAYCSGDKNLIKAFETGYSVHLIFAEILYPREFAQCVKDGVSFKDRYESTYYAWIKNGNFALIYGASETKANDTYRVPGAYGLIKKHLPLVDQFIRKMYDQGLSRGYVELLGGYRLQVPKSDPHKAANYFIQGSAGWAIQVAMNRVHKYLRSFPDHKMILQVHDELLFDFPVHTANGAIIEHIVNLMEQSGTDIGIPLPVEVKRCTESWAEGKKFTPFSLAV